MAYLKEGEWSCYRGGQHKEGEWSCDRGGKFNGGSGHVTEVARLRENGHVTEVVTNRGRMVMLQR